MLDGLYSAAAGLMAQQRRLDALSHDVANVSTTGYKRLRVGFRDLVDQNAGQGSAGGVTPGSGAAADVVGRGMAQGALRRTDRPLDVAIEGQGFFQVRRGGQVLLTRDGNFQVDNDGRLRTAQGDYLHPPVRIPRGTSGEELAIAPDGTVRAGNRRIGRIEVVTVRSTDGLAAAGDSTFRTTAASGGLVAAPDARLAQGSLEASNVDMGDAMVDMMDAQRSFGMASKAIQMQDQMAEIANGVKR